MCIPSYIFIQEQFQDESMPSRKSAGSRRRSSKSSSRQIRTSAAKQRWGDASRVSSMNGPPRKPTRCHTHGDLSPIIPHRVNEIEDCPMCTSDRSSSQENSQEFWMSSPYSSPRKPHRKASMAFGSTEIEEVWVSPYSSSPRKPHRKASMAFAA